MLIVITGTGTGIGKTHVAAALVGAWLRRLRRAGEPTPLVAGLKPIESGVSGPTDATDFGVLGRASTFHVQGPPPYAFVLPVSPHLAAREEGCEVDASKVIAYVRSAADVAHGVVVELPGGLFTPLGPQLTNAQFAVELAADLVLLVAPDRLGVLHDVGASVRAARAMQLDLAGVVLVTPESADASTGTNADELRLVTELPVLCAVPRASVRDLAEGALFDALVARLTTPSARPRRR